MHLDWSSHQWRQAVQYIQCAQGNAGVHKDGSDAQSEREEDQQPVGLYVAQHKHEAAARFLWHDSRGSCRGQKRAALVQNTAQALRPLVQAEGVQQSPEDPQRAAQVHLLPWCMLCVDTQANAISASASNKQAKGSEMVWGASAALGTRVFTTWFTLPAGPVNERTGRTT